ncbi:RNA-directed DNA polymerase [Salinicola endophyticus]|uniref:RNA-directed DNA polymerase n=1 Tax=Salinicola endophyticus TaxID=1949083 RepID=UPI000DA1FB7B|nr:RNA-directed DNA polymerase [Salinicola endophyticus]
MPVLNSKYDQLFLNDKYLTDPLLLALAWKKAHDYIRTTNWYADNFELDVSSIDLRNRCAEWAHDIEGKLKFEPLELVPAPKACPWGFIEPKGDIEKVIAEFKLIWKPADEKQLTLRPLAHVGIREQTIMTLLMMCLANDVESTQGDPTTSYDEVHDKEVVSYGNRLYCRYEDDKAEHSYGATTTYSKYFRDYRRFLQRPYYFASKALPEKSRDEEVYLVELDLSQFFDRVDRKELIKQVRDLSDEQKLTGTSNHTTRDHVLAAFEQWEWSLEAEQRFPEVCQTPDIKTAPKGLPQGLVASGFLANIYMLGFDGVMSSLIGDTIDLAEPPDTPIKLIDYCRYVDDIRLVVIAPNREYFESKSQSEKNEGESHLKAIKKALERKIETELDTLNLNLKLNEKKTKIEIYRGKSVGISKTLEDIQSSISGPVSLEDADTYLGQLESLLLLSNNKTHEQSETESSRRFNRLAAVEKDIFDVREDTLKRFTANKVTSLLSDIRHFTAREVDDNGQPIPGDWDYLQERLARRFIANWSHEPSLVLLLKKGLELFPSTKLLTPVLQQLRHLQDYEYHLWEDRCPKQAEIANYCMAEIFRHSATVIHRKDRHAIPAHADIDDFFEVLQDLAVDIASRPIDNDKPSKKVEVDAATQETIEPSLGEHRKRFDFLVDQARFLLLVRLDTTLEENSTDPFYDFILKLTKGFRNISLPKNFGIRDTAASILIAKQLVIDQKPVLRATASLLEVHNDPVGITELIAIQDMAFCRSLILHARPLKYGWLNQLKTNKIYSKLYLDTKPSAKALKDIKDDIAIYKLISRPDNPLANEIMALKLMQALLGKENDFQKAKPDDVIDLGQTKIQFGSYSNPPKFKAFEAELNISELAFHASLSQLAYHLHREQDELDDTFILQRIALCIRAVLAGSDDPTGFGQSITPNVGYRGLRSTQYKRQVGLLTTPEALVGEAAQFSAWLTTLLSKLLKWPGIRVNDQGYSWPNALTVEAVKQLVEKRLSTLKESYCQQSEIPGLPELITPNWDNTKDTKNSLKVAMVQAKMPQQNDFSKHGILLNDPVYRTKHRRHVARVATLITKHIEAQHLEKPKNGEREQDIDLIVLPELAVHNDDLDILVQLSRKTHAIVLSGLGFINQPGVKGPNNCAIWIVPRKHNGNQNEIQRFQGKHHMMEGERQINIQPWRPYQLMLELLHPKFSNDRGFVLTSAICFDSTDISLSADLRDKSNALLIPALNRDVNTFDSMVEALHYHMYQYIVLVNSGEFGGSYAMAPYNERHKRLIAHSSGNDQVTINTFKLNMFDFRRDGVGTSMKSGIKQKTPPAGVCIK